MPAYRKAALRRLSGTVLRFWTDLRGRHLTVRSNEPPHDTVTVRLTQTAGPWRLLTYHGWHNVSMEYYRDRSGEWVACTVVFNKPALLRPNLGEKA